MRTGNQKFAGSHLTLWLSCWGRAWAQSCYGECHGPLMVLAIILWSCRCMIGWLLSGGSAMKCEPPLYFLFFIFPMLCIHVMCTVWYSFAEGNLPARITQAHDIDSKVISERFESISGRQIYGISNWREWCSLERALGPKTMVWLSEVCMHILARVLWEFKRASSKHFVFV